MSTCAVVDLCVSFDQQVPRTKEDYCSLFDMFGFSSVFVINADIADDCAIYCDAKIGLDKIPKYGLKSGPNKHFLFNQRFLSAKGYDAIYQYELDVFPLRSGWLEKIITSTRFNKLISGSVYRGPTELNRRNLMHINGNAVYVCSHPSYKSWLSLVDRTLEYLVSLGHDSIAFDTVVFEYLDLSFKFDDKYSYQRLGLQDYQTQDDIRRLFCLFDYNERILNFSGSVERQDNYQVKPWLILDKYGSSETVVVHSDLFRVFTFCCVLRSNDYNVLSYLRDYAPKMIIQLGGKSVVYKKYVNSSGFIKKILNKFEFEHFFHNHKVDL